MRPDSGVSRPGEGGAGERHVWQTPGGGTVIGGGGQRSFTGPGGTTYNGGRGEYAYLGPHGGVAIGSGKGGSITGPGGNEISGGQSGHVVIGPNGNVHAGGSQGIGVKGPDGAAVAGRHGGVTVGPNGAIAHGSRGGIATGPGGTIAGGSRGTVAVGPNGAVASGGRFVAGRGAYGGAAFAGTHFVGASNLAGQGAYVRNSFRYNNAFTPNWYSHYPGAWFAAGWVGGSAWNACTWGSCASYCGYAEDVAPAYYNYGDNVTYQDGSVYYGDQPYATQDDYAVQSAQIAAAGQRAQPAPDEKWQPLGVFAMVQGEETTSNDIFQLALDQNGVLRGNYYNATSDSTTPVTGSLEKQSQRVAWTLEGKKSPVYETGLYNLTQAETTMLVHYAKDRTEQYKLFRVEQQSDDAGGPQPAPP
jgi:hypothetical protein